MKKISYFILVALYSFIFFPKLVSAHVLKTDGNIGAILHINPDDDPIAGQTSSFFFELKDREGKFKAGNCDCNITIIEDGKNIYSQSLFQNNPDPSLENISFIYVFPEKNIYQVILSGKPKVDNQFQSFNLIYDIRVAQITTPTGTPEDQSNSTSTLPISKYLFIIFGIFILGFISFLLLKKKTKI